MKKLFPAAIIAVFGVIVYTSCMKHNSIQVSHYCNCSYPSVLTGADSIIHGAYIGFSPLFSGDRAAVQCALHQDTVSKKYPGITCKLD